MILPRIRKLVLACCPVTVVVVGLAHVAGGGTTSFHIGNSLTIDSRPPALPGFAETRGLEHTSGYHARSGSSLTKIWENPTGEIVVTDPVFGNFTTALSGNTWDAVTLQPYTGNSLQQEVNSALEFINLTRSNPENADTVFYVYESWPDQLNAPYQVKWETPLSHPTNPGATRSRAFFDLFYESLSSETDATIRAIPVGEVLYQFDIAAQAGEVPGIGSVVQLYRDFIHMSLDVGRYVASATTFSTILNETPLRLTKPDGIFAEETNPLDPEFYAAVHRIIRNVLNEDDRTGVYFPLSDRNYDGISNGADLALWEESYPGPQFDVDSDGMVAASDFLLWQRRYETEPLEYVDSPANLDGEGLVDAADLAIWNAAYQVDSSADLDSDNDTDGLDYLALQRELTLFDGADVNRDRRIDGQDLESWVASYGYAGEVDFDEDGIVGGADFLLWQRESMTHSGPPITAAVETVPEPSSAMLVGLLIIPCATRAFVLATGER